MQQLQLYLYLKSPNGIKEQRDELQEWVNVCNGNSFGTILNISDAIAINDITTAQNLLNNWNKINKVDVNYATYLSFKINQMQNNNIDLKEVEALSLKCPLTDGSVVIAAQCLYNSLTNEHRLFDNSCGLNYNEEGNRAAITTNTKPLTKNNLLVYPNPSKNFINVLANDIQEATLIDITGKQLQIQKARANTITFNTSNLLPGLYLIKIKNNKGNIKIEKFVKD